MIKTISTSFKKHAVPAEHGSWFWLLLPFITGALVGRNHYPFNSNGLSGSILLLIGSLALFLLRQPVTSYIRNWRRGTEIKRESKQWILLLGSLGFLSLIGLLYQKQFAPLLIAIPALIAFLIYIIAAQFGRLGMRSIFTELIGAAALALTAPAALAIWEGYFSNTSWELWAILTLQNSLSIFYVRHRLSYKTTARAMPIEVVRTTHTMGLLTILLGVTALELPPLAILPFVFYFIRIIWATARPRQIEDIKQFGMLEVAISTIASTIYIIAYN